MQTFLDDGNQHVSADRNPDLRLHGVLGGAQKRLDAQVLLDPLKEQLHLPALAVQIGNEFWFQGKVVGQKRDALASLVFDHHAAQRLRVILAGIEHREHAALIANDGRTVSFDRIGVAPSGLGIALGAGHKEALCMVNGKESAEIQITAVQQVEGTWLDHQLVEHVDLDVAQGLPVGQLRKRHGEELIQAREVLDLVLALMGGHAASKRAQSQVGHELRENELALVHSGPSRESAKDRKSDVRRSNRHQTKTPNSASNSLRSEERRVGK